LKRSDCSLFALFSLTLGSKPKLRKQEEKRRRQDTYTNINSKTYYFVITDNTCDIGNKDPRPTKQQKPLSAPAITTPFYLRQSRLFISPLTISLKVNTQPQANHRCLSILIYNKSQTSQSPSAVTELVQVAEFKE
jgi:hypothetical protein